MAEKVINLRDRMKPRAPVCPEGEEDGTPTGGPDNVFDRKRWARLVAEAARGGPGRS